MPCPTGPNVALGNGAWIGHLWALPALCRAARVKSRISKKGQSQEGEGTDCSVPQREVAGGPYCVTHPMVKTGALTTDQRGCIHVCAVPSQLCLCASVLAWLLEQNVHGRIPSAQHRADSVGLISWLNK